MSQMDWRQALLRWRIQFRRGTTDAWVSANPVLLIGEPGWDQDLLRMKIGDGETAWNDLAWASLDPTQLQLVIDLIEGLTDLDDVRMTAVASDVDSDFHAVLVEFFTDSVADMQALIEDPSDPGTYILVTVGEVSSIDGGTP